MTAEHQSDTINLARLALAGQRGDVVALLRRMVRRAERDNDLGYAGSLASLLTDEPPPTILRDASGCR